MPSFSTRSSASAVTSSMSMSFSSSCSKRMRRASDTFTVRFFLRLGSISLSMSEMLSMPSGAPCDASTSNIGAVCGVTSTSTSRSSSFPSSSSWRSLSRVRL